MTTMTIADVAKSVKMTPKAARSKLRKASNAPKGTSKSRWVFSTAEAKKVKALLQA